MDGAHFDEIRALNGNGKHFEAFQKWYQFAESWYTEKRLEDFCNCLVELGKDVRPKLIEVAKEIRKLLQGNWYEVLTVFKGTDEYGHTCSLVYPILYSTSQNVISIPVLLDPSTSASIELGTL